MKPLSETLTELGIAFSFPIVVKDANGRVTYYENSVGTKRGTPKSAKTCEGKVSEEEWRAFCDERFHQLLERNKMVRLKNR